MTEADILEVLNLYADNSINSFALYITFTSAFLIAVYTIGRDLSRFQATVFAVLYVVAASAPALACVMHCQSLKTLASKHTDILHSSLWLFPWPTFIPIIFVSGILVSLYFLYDMRRVTHIRKL